MPNVPRLFCIATIVNLTKYKGFNICKVNILVWFIWLQRK